MPEGASGLPREGRGDLEKKFSAKGEENLALIWVVFEGGLGKEENCEQKGRWRRPPEEKSRKKNNYCRAEEKCPSVLSSGYFGQHKREKKKNELGMNRGRSQMKVREKLPRG